MNHKEDYKCQTRPILDLVIAMKEVSFDLEAVVNVFSRECGDLMFFALESRPER